MRILWWYAIEAKLFLAIPTGLGIKLAFFTNLINFVFDCLVLV